MLPLGVALLMLKVGKEEGEPGLWLGRKFEGEGLEETLGLLESEKVWVAHIVALDLPVAEGQREVVGLGLGLMLKVEVEQRVLEVLWELEGHGEALGEG